MIIDTQYSLEEKKTHQPVAIFNRKTLHCVSLLSVMGLHVTDYFSLGLVYTLSLADVGVEISFINFLHFSFINTIICMSFMVLMH